MLGPDIDTQLILDRLEREGHIALEPDGKHFKVTSSKYAFLKKLDVEPYPYFCIYLSDKLVTISKVDFDWAQSVADRCLENSVL